MTKAPALSVARLSYAYGPRRVLDGVGFAVRAGECAILLGPNGAGKSTLFALITHLYDSPDGTVTINGYDLKSQSHRALAGLGVVFQQATLDPDLTVRQNLLYHAALHGLSRRVAVERMAEELGRQGLMERCDDPVRLLNGGHRRRVEIARALLHRPALLLLDEPTVGLDVPSRQAIVDYIHRLCRERGVAVLWATHLIDELDPGDRLLILHQGTLRADGRVAEVLAEAGAGDVAAAFAALTRDGP